MKKVYVVHGGEATSKSDFLPWLKKELDKRKIKSYFPNMPNSEEPSIDEWIGFLKNNVKDIDKDTIFIGHSMGCPAILRFLETLPKKFLVAKCIFVAPWMKMDKNTLKEYEEAGEKELGIEIGEKWFETPIDWKKVKIHCRDFVCIFSDNDPYVPLSNFDLFRRKLRAKVLVLKNRHHFNEGNGIFKLPEILDFLK